MENTTKNSFLFSSAQQLQIAIHAFLTDDIPEITPAHIESLLKKPKAVLFNALVSKKSSAEHLAPIVSACQDGADNMLDEIILAAQRQVYFPTKTASAFTQRGKEYSKIMLDEMPSVFIPAVERAVSAVLKKYLPPASAIRSKNVTSITSTGEDIINNPRVTESLLSNAAFKVILLPERTVPSS